MHIDYCLRKIIDWNKIETTVLVQKFLGKRIVFTNGCFDLLHKGHVHTLAAARDHGDYMIVGLNSDASVRRLKGEERPINGQADRALVLASLLYVDAVVIFDEDTPYNLIKLVVPDVLVKGGDYKIENVVGADIAKETVIIPYIDNYSTTGMIERLKD